MIEKLDIPSFRSYVYVVLPNQTQCSVLNSYKKNETFQWLCVSRSLPCVCVCVCERIL